MSKFFFRRFFCVCLGLIFINVDKKKTEKTRLSLYTYSVCNETVKKNSVLPVGTGFVLPATRHTYIEGSVS